MRLQNLLAYLLTAALGQGVAQPVISNRSGLVLVAEGAVVLEGKPVQAIGGRFPALANGEVLRIEEGRAEMLVGPGVFLWLGPNSSIRMNDDRLVNVQIELLAGTAILQAPDLPAGNLVTLTHGDGQFHVANHGRYRVDASAAQWQMTEGYSRKPDEFDKWAWQRLQAIWAENLKSARLIARAERNKKDAHGIQRPYPGPVLALPGRT